MLLCVYTMLCAVADIYIIRTFRSMVRNAELERQIALLDQQQSLERAQYEAVGAQMQSMRRLRHDYTNTLSTVGTLLDMGETQKIRDILANTSDQLAKTRIVHTGNATVDAVLYGKTADAAQKGVSLSCALLWPESCTVPDTDLMRIFSNLLDNAIHYCETLPEDVPRRIEVTSVLQGNMAALNFSNTFLGETPPAIPESGADAAHGHGLAIVKEIAERNGGALVSRVENGMLTFRVLLAAKT